MIKKLPTKKYTQKFSSASDESPNLIVDVPLDVLIGRNFEKPNLDELTLNLKGKCVLVTGAGGSIGSELCRQLSTLPVKKIVFLDHSELNLFHVSEEFEQLDNDIECIFSLTSICDLKALENVFRKHKPDYVYHAAAYKHVHLVEQNPYAGIINNLLGTKNVLDICTCEGVEKFILISTDKAVRPTNIMGATKRLCELLVTQYADDYEISCSSVRFGNVAGSSGSLIPKLKEKIRKNDPLTITDERMTRFFMLIPEAVSLVLKSSEASKSGDIALLNMGKSIKVIDVARRLLRLSGKDPDHYPITITGAREGEKLYEELSIKGLVFKDDEQFVFLKDGDNSFKKFTFYARKYPRINDVVNDVVMYARNYSPKAVDLMWATIMVELADSVETEIDDDFFDAKGLLDKGLEVAS